MDKQISLDEILKKMMVNFENKPIEEILLSKDLAKLGDAYVNFVYSLSVSIRKNRPCGVKVSNRILADAVRMSGVRLLLPHRLSRHDIGGAGEALSIYSVFKGIISTQEIIQALIDLEDPAEAFTYIFKKLRRAGNENESSEI
ncbi:MAG: ribonuclease III family protein [Candidatus Bathyarchaeota archaeon]